MASESATNGRRFLVMVGINPQSLRDAGRGHRMLHLLDYFERRLIPYTVAFPSIGEAPGIWKRGSGTYVSLGLKWPGFKTTAKGGRSLSINMAGWLRSYLDFCRKNPGDICIAQGEFMAILAVAMKHLGHVRFVAYEDLDYLRAFMGPSISRALTGLEETWAVRNCDLVVSVSERLAKLRREQGARSVAYVPNGVDLSSFRPSGAGDRRSPTILYSGMLAKWSGVEKIVQAMPEVIRQVKDAQLLIVGSGFQEQYLKNLCASLQIEKSVRFLGPRPKEELPALYAQSMIGAITFQNDELAYYSFPLKVPEYLACGLPVVSTGADGASDLLRTSGSGLVVGDSPASIASAFVELLTNEIKWKDMSSRAVAAARDLDWNILFDAELKHIIDAASRSS